jgi:hypothetical protein
MSDAKRVLLLEINEITWNLIDPLIEAGKLPTFKFLKQKGAIASPMSVDLPPHLDPWITWTTVHTGTPQSEHNLFFLQQPAETIHSKRSWEYLSEMGHSVGVYGSVCSYPPVPVKGFYIPDTFSPDSATYPESLRPIQDLNLTYTRSIRLPKDTDTLGFRLKTGMSIMQLGLKLRTLFEIFQQLVRERLNPKVRWQRVALQPAVNFDFFQKLYRKHRPTFATFHTNHVAHYQHTYWKAMQPNEFLPLETDSKEVETFGKAIEYGYVTADRLLKRVLGLLDESTVLVVASSMGQKPFKTALKGGKKIAQVRSLDRLLELLGVNGRATAVPMMSDQFNIYGKDDVLHEVSEALKAVYVDIPAARAFVVKPGDKAVTATLVRSDAINENSILYFPQSPQAPQIKYDDLIYFSGQVKSGCHDPKGMLIMYGAGVKAGAIASECNNLDIAPTLFHLMGVPAPSKMRGRILTELLSGQVLNVKDRQLMKEAVSSAG